MLENYAIKFAKVPYSEGAALSRHELYSLGISSYDGAESNDLFPYSQESWPKE